METWDIEVYDPFRDFKPSKWFCPKCRRWVKEEIGKMCKECRDERNS